MSKWSSVWKSYRQVPSVYRITNKVTGESYIGATSNTGQRWLQHLGSNDLPIQRDLEKLGPENFTFEILEVTVNLAQRERYWIRKLNPTYNKTRGGEGSFRLSTRRAMSDAQKKLHADPAYKEKQKQGMKRTAYRLPDGTEKLLRPQDVGRYKARGIILVKIS